MKTLIKGIFLFASTAFYTQISHAQQQAPVHKLLGDTVQTSTSSQKKGNTNSVNDANNTTHSTKESKSKEGKSFQQPAAITPKKTIKQ